MEVFTVPAPEFDRSCLAGGKHFHLTLQIPGWSELDLEVQVIRGVRPGKTLLMIASDYGDEYEGVRTILDLCRELNPA